MSSKLITIKPVPTIKECKECPLVRIQDGKPICMFSNENSKDECKLERSNGS